MTQNAINLYSDNDGSYSYILVYKQQPDHMYMSNNYQIVDHSNKVEIAKQLLKIEGCMRTICQLMHIPVADLGGG